MSAPRRVSNAHVKAAIEATRENITQAAETLGIASNNLRKRLEGVGMGPAELAQLRGEAQGSVRSLRVSADVFETLRQGKFDLRAKQRRELDEATVLAEFVADGFEGWLAAKLGRAL